MMLRGGTSDGKKKGVHCLNKYQKCKGTYCIIIFFPPNKKILIMDSTSVIRNFP